MKYLTKIIFTATALAAFTLQSVAQVGDAPKKEGRPDKAERGDRPDSKKKRPDGNKKGRKGSPDKHRGPGGNSFMIALDADKNGEISAEEMINAPAKLAQMDKNKDGKLTIEEIRPPQQGSGGQGEPKDGGRPQERGKPSGMAERLKALDKNENGNLEADELPERVRDRMLEHLDKNGDSVISKDELAKGAEAMRKRRGGGKGKNGGDKEGGGTVKPKKPPVEE